MPLPFVGTDDIGATKIPELTDVALNNLTNEQILKYNSVTEKWENSDNVTTNTLQDLTDTNINNPQSAQVLSYDNLTSKWINSTILDLDTLENLTDTNISNKQEQDFLLYDSWSGKWLNAPSNLENHKDITITTVGDNEVLKYNSTSGKWENEPARLAECGDTNISNLQNNQVLKYNSTSSKWENTERIDSLNELGDVNVSTVTNNQVLKYNNSTNLWENTFVNLTELNDTNIPSLNEGDTLRYDSATGKWLGEALNLNNVDDVNINSVANDQVLKYNSSSGKWENSSLSLSGALFPNAGSTDEVKNGRGDITTGTTITDIRNNNSTLDDVVAKMLELEAPLNLVPSTKGLSFVWVTSNTQIKLGSSYNSSHTARFNRGSWNNAYEITGTTLNNGNDYNITTTMTSVSPPTITVYSKAPFAYSYNNTTNTYNTITLKYYVYKPLFVNSVEIISSYSGTSTTANSPYPVTYRIYSNTNDVVVPDHVYNYVISIPFSPTNVYIYDSAFSDDWIVESTNDWFVNSITRPTYGTYYDVTLTRNRTAGDIKLSN